MIWVIDASVAVRWFIEEEAHSHADEILTRLIERPDTFAVPELFAFEVYAVLQRLHPAGLKVYREGMLPLLQSGIFRQPMTESLAVRADRFVKKGLTGYDASYAALAKDLKGLWLTYDEKAHRLIETERVSCFVGKQMPSGWST
jgi:predicted nucleic acid-binding protein